MSAERDALARLVAALDAWEVDAYRPTVDLARSQELDAELATARDLARAVLMEDEPR